MTLLAQAVTALAIITPSVLAPVAAADFGFEPIRIGLLVSIVYLIAMFSGLITGALIARHGPVRVLQVCVMIVAIGMAAAAGGNVLLLVVFAVLSGVAHGMINPTTSQILHEASPVALRPLIFSIKQTGVPVGAAAGGLILPSLLLFMNWQAAVLVVAAVIVFFLPFLAPFRATYDSKLKPDSRVVLANLAATIFEVCSHRHIRDLAFASGVFSSVQLCLFTYLISYLKLDLGFSLIVAGLIFSVAQGAGIGGRVLWGVVADRFMPARRVLALLGFTMFLCGIATMMFSAAWPVALLVLVCMVYGATAVGWNGVFLAEVARLAPEGKVGVITGGSQFFTFFGAMLGPPVFGAIASYSGGYAYGFALFALLPLISGLQLWFGAAPRPVVPGK